MKKAANGSNDSPDPMSQRYRIVFNPTIYVPEYDRTALLLQLEEQRVSHSFELDIFRLPARKINPRDTTRPVVWAIEAPLGLLASNFRDAAVTLDEHIAQQRKLHETLQRQLAVKRNLWHRSRDFFVRDDKPFYRRNALEMVASGIEQPYFVHAMVAFLRRAEQDPMLVKGAPRPARPFVPHEKRREVFPNYLDRTCRGPGWTSDEDAVLRRWFGVRQYGEFEGRHAKLTEEEWAAVLDHLGGRRTVDSIQNRIYVLNRELRARYLVNGYVPRTLVREYMQQVLGETPRRPRMGPHRTKRRRKDAPASPNVATTPTP